jgi:hypothetical protein
MDRARLFRHRERSVGLGLMGFHSFLQKQGVAMESATAKSWNNEHLQAHPPRRGRGVGEAGERARALPGRG